MSDNPMSPSSQRKGTRATSAETKNKSRLTTLAPGENLKEKQVSATLPLSDHTSITGVSCLGVSASYSTHRSMVLLPISCTDLSNWCSNDEPHIISAVTGHTGTMCLSVSTP